MIQHLDTPSLVRRPRVLVVEDDPELAMATVNACLEAGLEPKLCMGPARAGDCPGLKGAHCPRSDDIAATLLAVSTGPQRVAAPACVGGRLAVAGERPLLGPTTVSILDPEVILSYPYDPSEAASALAELAQETTEPP